MKALVVDDSHVTRRVIQLVLKSNHIESCDAEDGEAAIRILKEDSSIGLVMVDWNMPNVSGHQFLKQVRSLARYDGLKIFVVTASDTLETLEAARIAGADDILLKPVSKSLIANKLQIHGLN